MKTIRFIPGHVVQPAEITIPTGAPLIDRVVSAEITRIADTITLAHGDSGAPVDHNDGVVVGHTGFAIADHDPHIHDIITFGAVGAPAGGVFGLDAVPVAAELQDSGALGTHSFAGGGATGIQDGALSAHAVTQPTQHEAADVVLGLHDHPSADIAAALNNHAAAGVTPVVAATPVRDTARTFHLNVDTELGDLLILSYVEVGERALVA